MLSIFDQYDQNGQTFPAQWAQSPLAQMLQAWGQQQAMGAPQYGLAGLFGGGQGFQHGLTKIGDVVPFVPRYGPGSPPQKEGPQDWWWNGMMPRAPAPIQIPITPFGVRPPPANDR